MPRKKPGRRANRRPDELSDREQRFVSEYAIDANGTRAYIAAGYSRKNPAPGAWRLMKRPRVKTALEALRAKHAEHAEITAERYDRELAAIGFSDLRRCFDAKGKLLPVSQWPDDVAAAIASVEVVDGARGRDVVHKVRLWNKPETLVTVGKRFNLLRDTLDVNHHGVVKLDTPEAKGTGELLREATELINRLTK